MASVYIYKSGRVKIVEADRVLLELTPRAARDGDTLLDLTIDGEKHTITSRAVRSMKQWFLDIVNK